MNYLIQTGRANVNLQNKMGWTALMCACRNEHVEVARLLVSKGADVNLVDGANKSALQRAQAQQKTAVVAFLQSVG